MMSSNASAHGRQPRAGSASSVSAWVLLALPVLALLAAAGPAAAVNHVAFYWDEAFTQTDTDIGPVPAVATGYLVMSEVTDPLGVLGFELCLDFEGRVQVANVEYGGDAINLLEPPCFVVGYASPVPPVAGHSLLATCTLLINDARPTRITAGPTLTPSLPGEMAWIPGSEPEVLEVLTTVDGGAQIASFNLDNPSYAFEPDVLDFGERPIGLGTTRLVTVSNTGLVPVDLDLGISAGCEGFELTGIQGPLHLPVGEAAQIAVRFTPTLVGPYSCELTVGPGLPGLPLLGRGREPVTSYTVSATRYFGEVAVGNFRDVTAAFRNDGETPLAVTPQLIGCGDAFSIVAGGDSTIVVTPGGLHLVNVRFAPVVEGPAICALGWGPDYDQTPLDGTGIELALEYTVTGHLNCGAVPIGAFVDRSITITNIGEAPFMVAPAMIGCTADLQMTTSGELASLAPGQARVVGIRYRPTVTDSISCAMGLGEIVAAEPILASTRDEGLVISAPDTVDFGMLEVGETGSSLIRIRNIDSVSYTISPLLIACSAEFRIVSGGGTRVLSPGEIWNVQIDYQPVAVGAALCALDLGIGLPAVALVGQAQPAVPRAAVEPDSVVFAATQPGTGREAAVRIANVGFVPFDIAPALSGNGFVLGNGGTPGTLLPGQSRLTSVWFYPDAYGEYTGRLEYGPGLPTVPLAGLGADVVEACDVSPSGIDFGSVVIGEPLTRPVTVTNIGNVTLELAPTAAPSVFRVEPATAQLAPGASTVFSVTFDPNSDAAYVGLLQLGGGNCPSVSLFGRGTYPDPPEDANQLGIFFDDEYLLNEIELAPITIGSGHLVLRDASSFLGVSGWECLVSTYGQAIVLTWELQGQALNIGTPPEFVVGIASPLPWRRNIVLMDFQFLTLDANPVFFAVDPTSVPSLPGHMAWVDGSGTGLRAMYPITGESIVASVNDAAPVGVAAPTPLCAVTGGEVRLSWRAETGPDDRCHVYRRVGEAPVERLTDAPLAPTGDGWSYVDTPAGFAPGTVLHYSYAIVRDGAELARSPEVSVTLAEVPVTATRLLPNVPNPFNPQTEIRFETERPGRVWVTVFDVTGRLVKVLQDGHLERGRWARTWQGRDEAGRVVASGAYYVRLEVDGRVDHRKIMLLK